MINYLNDIDVSDVTYDLHDKRISEDSASQGQALVYDSTTQTWKPTTISSGNGVFYATYGTTTFSEILEAINSSKAVYCKYIIDDTTMELPLISFTSTTAVFEVQSISDKYDVYGHQATINSSNIWAYNEISAGVSTKQPQIQIAASRPAGISSGTIWYKEQAISLDKFTLDTSAKYITLEDV